MYLDRLFQKIDPKIEDILQKAMDRKNITDKDANNLFEVKNSELEALLLVAKRICYDKFEKKVTYVVNRNINFTNICKNRCLFCKFRREKKSKDAYTLSLDQIFKKIDSALPFKISEVCIQGGLNEDIDFDYILHMVGKISKRYPKIHIHAFSPMEISYYSKKADIGIEEVLKSLKEVGLGSICGTASEILDDSIRKEICPQKIDSNTWVDVIKKAHSLDIPSTSTILYGHIEDANLRVKHMKKIKEIQNKTKKFTEFIPLRYIKNNDKLDQTDEDNLDFKMIAISRIYFINSISNIQTSWVKLGPKLAADTLSCGANDFGGTLIEENITKSNLYLNSKILEEHDILNWIKKSGYTPKLRDTLYSHQSKIA